MSVTQPGIYDMPAAQYHSDPVPSGSLSQSGAKLLLPPSCPALYRYDQDHPAAPKREFDLGHAAHREVLGAGAELVIIDAPNYKTKAAQQQRDEAYDDCLTPVLPHEYEQVQAMAKAVREHPKAGRLFAPGTGQPEQALFWQDDRTGVWRRAMLDWLPANVGQPRMVISDYKTAASAAPDRLQRAIYEHGYHIQGAWYEDAVRALGIHPEPVFVLVLQEKKAPYLITVVQLPAQATQAGRELGRRAVDIYRHCVETDTWPAYSDGIEVVDMPIWLENKYIAEEILT